MSGHILKLNGGQTLEGTVTTSGSKNASLPIIAASLLLSEVTLHNVPRIGDVMNFLEIIKSLGSQVEFTGNTLTMHNTNLSLENLNYDLMKKLRVSILLLWPLLQKFSHIKMPYPGGCNIGKRGISEHTNGFVALGYCDTSTNEIVEVTGQIKEWDIRLPAGFSVTATENLVTASVLRKGITIIELAAIEPHVINLIEFLTKAGANIKIAYDHTITVRGVEKLESIKDFSVIHDAIESGTFIIAWALCAKEYIDIHHARIRDLARFLEKCTEAGVQFEDLGNDTLRVYRCDHPKSVAFQTNIFPGFPTDLQSIFAILLTQAEGISKIHEIIFEWRLNYLVEIEKMKGHPAILNPHQALIFGKTPLRWTTVSSWDLRAGVAMILAGLIAKWETSITNIEYIERGYEDIISKFRDLGAIIEKMESP